MTTQPGIASIRMLVYINSHIWDLRVVLMSALYIASYEWRVRKREELIYETDIEILPDVIYLRNKTFQANPCIKQLQLETLFEFSFLDVTFIFHLLFPCEHATGLSQFFSAHRPQRQSIRNVADSDGWWKAWGGSRCRFTGISPCAAAFAPSSDPEYMYSTSRPWIEITTTR